MSLFMRVASVAVVLLSVIVLPASARADDALSVRAENGNIEFDNLAPGRTRTSEIEVTNRSAFDARIVLEVLGLGDLENECLQQETRAGDWSCGHDEGELAQWLRVTVGHEGTTLWNGPLTMLVHGAELPEVLPAGATWNLDFTIEFAFAAGNETMTDRVTFDLRWTGATQSNEGEADILGVQAIAAGGGSAGDGQNGIALPFTGGTVSPGLLALTSALLAAGFLLISISKRRRGYVAINQVLRD